MYEIHNSECLAHMRTMEDNSVDAIVTDPPYGMNFMGKKWDYDVPSVEIWQECLRVLKPGGHMLTFAGTRTYHRMVVRIEDAGFEVRDMIAWVFASGMPKSLDVSKAIDKVAGVEREIVGKVKLTGTARKSTTHTGHGAGATNAADPRNYVETYKDITVPATEAAKKWDGWGTALKPAFEPIAVLRKPLAGTVAKTVLQYGTGGINIGACRIAVTNTENQVIKPEGRWPANFCHDSSDEVLELFPSPHGAGKARSAEDGTHSGNVDGVTNFRGSPAMRFGDKGSAARFYFCAKASKKDRDEGCEDLEAIHRVNGNKWTDIDYRVLRGERPPSAESGPRRNFHATVKPTALMRWLCRLVTPPGGVVLDPFMGSGSTGKAALLEGFNFIGIERETDYFNIAQKRLSHAYNSTPGEEE
jgi:site-specific DNA-methyltransferase (adenine-specific)